MMQMIRSSHQYISFPGVVHFIFPVHIWIQCLHVCTLSCFWSYMNFSDEPSLCLAKYIGFPYHRHLGAAVIS